MIMGFWWYPLDTLEIETQVLFRRPPPLKGLKGHLYMDYNILFVSVFNLPIQAT